MVKIGLVVLGFPVFADKDTTKHRAMSHVKNLCPLGSQNCLNLFLNFFLTVHRFIDLPNRKWASILKEGTFFCKYINYAKVFTCNSLNIHWSICCAQSQTLQ